MAIQTITYENKVAINTNSNIPEINKVTDSNMNEIKNIVNNNADNIGDLANLQTTSTDNLVNAINSNLPVTLYDNPSGTFDTITLTDNASNYSRIDIVHGNTSVKKMGIKTTTIYNPDGQSVNLSMQQINNDSEIQQYQNIWYFNGKSLTRTYQRAITFKSNSVTIWSSNTILLYKVIGYK